MGKTPHTYLSRAAAAVVAKAPDTDDIADFNS